MPGFARNNYAKLAVEPTPEEIEQMRADGMNPLVGDALIQAQMKSGPSRDGIDFGQYVPMYDMEPFLRLRQAHFNLAEFERLGDLSYTQMIRLRWMARADQKAENDLIERQSR